MKNNYIMKNFNICDIILMHCFKRYTNKVYRAGVQDGFNWNNK